MTVKELIEKLGKYDPDMIVVVDGYEDGYDNPRIDSAEVVLDSNWDGDKKRSGWSGRHDDAWGEDRAEKAVKVTFRRDYNDRRILG